MLDHLNLEKLLFIDVETVPGHPAVEDLDPDMQVLWEKKSQRLKEEDTSPQEHYFGNAGIYAEFGKIICISVGFMINTTSHPKIRLKSFAGDDEKEVLNAFGTMLFKYYNDISKNLLCGHNIKEFDIPYICRRMLVNNLKLPRLLNISGLKPWEVPHVDTMQLWKFGDYKHYTSLNLLAHLFDIPTPKDDIDGSEVGSVYYNDGDLNRIVEYCQKDVLTVAQLMLRFQGKQIMDDSQVEIVQ